MNIALIGFRGTGKTAISRLLAKRLDKKVVSTDEEISRKIRMSVPTFVKRHGWDRLRDIESDVIEHVSDFDDCIFDTGSGIVMRNENIINLRRNALVIMLTSDIGTIRNRLRHAKAADVSQIRNALYECESRYKRAADYAIDTSRLSPEEACDLIAHYVLVEMQ